MKHLQSDKDSRQMAGQQPEGQRYPIVLTRDLVTVSYTHLTLPTT